MNTITGKVLHKESGLGVSDLIVAVYDLDPNLSQFYGQGQDASSEIRPPSDTLAQLSKQLLSGQQLSGASLQAYLQFIYYGSGADQEEDPSLRTPFSIAGDRIGSVITNNQGEFSLNYDDAAFQVNEQEIRPDLVLYILAPEYSVEISPPDAGEFQVGPPEPEFVPVPEHLRVLHFSLFPRRNAGRLESYVIKLASEQLRRQQITPPDQAQDNPVDFATLLNADANRKTHIQNSLREARQKELSYRREIEQESTIFVQNLSAVPKALRESPLFVGQGTTADAATAEARQRGVGLISGYSGSSRLRLSDENLRALGIRDPSTVREQLEQNGRVQINARLDNLCGLLQQKNGGTELTRQVPDLLRQLRNVSEFRIDETPGGEAVLPPGDDDVNGTEVESPLSVEEQIKQIVLERVQEMKLFEPDEEEDQVQRISKTIRDLTPPASPADVTAFYDFHHLQIAFPDVWAEAFDGDVTELIRQMDIQYREYTDQLEVARDSDEMNPANLADVNEYTRLMGKLIGDIASLDNVPPMTPKVQELLGQALSPSAQIESGVTRVNVGGAVVAGEPQLGRISDVIAQYKGRQRAGGVSSTVRVRGGSSTTRVDSTTIDSTWQQLSIAQKVILNRIANDQITEQVSIPDESYKKLIGDLLGKDNADLVNAGINLLREVKQPDQVGTKPIRPEEKLRRTIEIISNPEGRVTRVQQFLQQVAERLQEPYSFRVFQKNTVNFGIITTYRQEWTPGNYQVGSLVSSLPLAPGETRKYSKKHSTKKTRAQKENEKNASTLSDERSITARATSDIVDKANSATNFEMGIQTQASGGFLGIVSVGANTNTSFSRNQSAESQRTKNAFHEAVRKASQEYKSERSLEVSTEDISEFESTFTAEISNPNNEISVTYLFYELERQYRVTERLHKLTPVVLVAQEVPNPADIDEDWLLAHEWIMRRVLLDNSFNAALDYIAQGLVGDEVSLEVKREHYEIQKALVEDLGTTVATLTSLQDTMRETLIQTSEQEKLAREDRKRGKKRRRRNILRGIFGIPPRIASGASSLTLGRRGEDPAVLEARREALETRLNFLEGNLEDVRSQLTAANSGLEEATVELTAAIEDSFTQRNLVNQLRIHVKDNILYYMQMIWSYEHPDQRYFRLYDIPVRVPIPSQPAPPAPAPDGTVPPPPPLRTRITIESNTNTNILNAYAPLLRNSTLRNDIFASLRLEPPSPAQFDEKRLHEIADLDNLMGFKGNYMIFPLKQCTYITDFMMQDYIDDYLGIRDPDLVGDFTTDELLRYAEALYHSEDFSDEEKTEARAAINRLVQERLTSPRVENELIVVPTGQLFIEALKGEHALLENFKQLHRQLDVQKVEEEIRAAQLENLRHAMRLTQEEPLLEHSKVDKKIVIEGNGSGVIVPSEG
jgi:hypothetical protein